MKKLILPLLVCLCAFGSVNATSLKTEKNNIENPGYDVSTFCKLIQKGDFDVVKSMIEIGEDVNKKSKGLTPLMFAARHNRVDIVNLLLAKGAELNTKSDRDNITALKIAERSKALDAIKVLEVAIKK